MKKCPNCQSVFEDSKGFCPKCGAALESVTQTQTRTPAPSGAGNAFFAGWGGLIMGVVGLLICWELSAVLGCAIAIGGAVFGWQSDNAVNKIGSLILAIVSGVLTVITMLV